MFRIGEFSRLSHVTVKALRYYDDIGLLKPARVDGDSGYRYYSLEQLSRLHRILALRDLGFSLEQIDRLLHKKLSPEQIRGMLCEKQAQLQDRVREEQERLERVETRLRQIEQEGTMPDYEVIVKNVEPQRVASIRETLPTYPHIGGLITELYGYLNPLGADGVCAAIWHDTEHKERDVDGEAVIYLEKPVPGSERIKVYELPEETVASTIHHGSYRTLCEAYTALLTWIETNGYRLSGPSREIYLEGGPEQENASYITELQFPGWKA